MPPPFQMGNLSARYRNTTHLGFVDHRLLARSFCTVAFDRYNVGGIHRAHHLEVLQLVAHLDKLMGGGLQTHRKLLCERSSCCSCLGGTQLRTAECTLPWRRGEEICQTSPPRDSVTQNIEGKKRHP